MMQFRYKALTREGRSAHGAIEAVDLRDATRLLGARGLVVTEVTALAGRRPWKRKRTAALSADDVVSLLREWATLLSAGLTIDEGLAVCASGGKSKKVLQAIEAVRRAIRDGRPFHAALADNAILPREAIVLVEAGEEAGALPRVLERLADESTQNRAAQETLLTALLYPAVLLATTIVALAVIVLVVAPNLAELFESARGVPPARIQALLAFSTFVRVAAPFLVLLVIGVILAFAFASRNERARQARDALVLRLPFIGGIVRSLNSARFASAGALMIQCGVVPTKALPLAASAMANSELRRAIGAALTDAARGMPLQEALARAKALPSDLLALIGAGLRTGRLADVLHHGGLLHAARARAQIERFSALLTPAITVFAGIVVGGLAYLVLTAVVSLNEVAFQ